MEMFLAPNQYYETKTSNKFMELLVSLDKVTV